MLGVAPPTSINNRVPVSIGVTVVCHGGSTLQVKRLQAGAAPKQTLRRQRLMSQPESTVLRCSY